MIQIFLFLLLIGVFIFGMTLLRRGLFHLSADSFKEWIARVTDTPAKGFFIGIIITAILHSSAAVMVITIGLISAGILTFSQSIGIILGTNIGTTFTAEMITFEMDPFLVPLAIIGALLILFKKKSVRSTGFILFGISAVFTAMRGFEYLAGPLTSVPAVNNLLMTINENLLFSVLFGAAATAIIQSSTAMTGIIMSFLSGGIISLATGIGMMLGSNIGTCITAFIASIGSGKEAKLTAYAHIWLNVLGVLVFFPFIHTLAELGPRTASNQDVQLAHMSVLFNVFSSLLVLPFASRFGKWIMWLHGRGLKR